MLVPGDACGELGLAAPERGDVGVEAVRSLLERELVESLALPEVRSRLRKRATNKMAGVSRKTNPPSGTQAAHTRRTPPLYLCGGIALHCIARSP